MHGRTDPVADRKLSELDLHSTYLLISFERFVAHLERKLHRHAGAFHRDHQIVDLDSRLTRHEGVLRFSALRLRVLNFLQGVHQHFSKVATIGVLRLRGSLFEAADEGVVDSHGAYILPMFIAARIIPRAELKAAILAS